MRNIKLSAAAMLLLAATQANAVPSAPGLIEFKCHIRSPAAKDQIVFVEAKNPPHAKFLLLEKAAYKAAQKPTPKRSKDAAPAGLPQILECRPLAETFSGSEAQALDLATPR